MIMQTQKTHKPYWILVIYRSSELALFQVILKRFLCLNLHWHSVLTNLFEQDCGRHGCCVQNLTTIDQKLQNWSKNDLSWPKTDKKQVLTVRKYTQGLKQKRTFDGADVYPDTQRFVPFLS